MFGFLFHFKQPFGGSNGTQHFTEIGTACLPGLDPSLKAIRLGSESPWPAMLIHLHLGQMNDHISGIQAFDEQINAVTAILFVNHFLEIAG